jgi:hypothetical protein
MELRLLGPPRKLNLLLETKTAPHVISQLTKASS